MGRRGVMGMGLEPALWCPGALPAVPCCALSWKLTACLPCCCLLLLPRFDASAACDPGSSGRVSSIDAEPLNFPLRSKLFPGIQRLYLWITWVLCGTQNGDADVFFVCFSVLFCVWLTEERFYKLFSFSAPFLPHRQPPVSESHWRMLLQDMLTMQQNVYTCLDSDACYEVPTHGDYFLLI